MRRLALTGLLAVGLVGCSQVQALSPVGGKTVAEARAAGEDVLVAQRVAILTAPVCATQQDKTDPIRCAGTTVAQEDIVVTVTPGSPKDTLDVTVGSRPIFHGYVQDVLAAAAGPVS